MSVTKYGSRALMLAGPDWWKIGKGALIAIGGAALVAAAQATAQFINSDLLPQLQHLDVWWVMYAVVPAQALVNLILKFVTDTR